MRHVEYALDVANRAKMNCRTPKTKHKKVTRQCSMLRTHFGVERPALAKDGETLLFNKLFLIYIYKSKKASEGFSC